MKHQPWRRDAAAYPTQGTLQPRFTDVDLWQHLNNVAQIGLHGELLQQWLHAHLGSDPWRRPSPKLVLQANATDFLAEAHYPAPLATGTRLLGCDDHRLTLATALFQHGHCTGLHQATLGAFDGDTAVPLPADWRAALQAAAAQQPPLPDASDGAPDALPDLPAPPHPDLWPWQITLGARFADADGQGHASDFTLARCAEQGRVQFLTQVFGDGRRSAPVGFMVAHVALRWHRRRLPPTPPQAWQLGIGVSKVGERSLSVASALFDGADCLATSSSVMVVIDHTTRRPAALSAEARALLAPYLVALG
jgi:acyl-CoA thioester hydrolase